MHGIATRTKRHLHCTAIGDVHIHPLLQQVCNVIVEKRERDFMLRRFPLTRRRAVDLSANASAGHGAGLHLEFRRINLAGNTQLDAVGVGIELCNLVGNIKATHVLSSFLTCSLQR